jgi:hypothetical protein
VWIEWRGKGVGNWKGGPTIQIEWKLNCIRGGGEYVRHKGRGIGGPRKRKGGTWSDKGPMLLNQH